ncbi:MAG: hypothetical protein AAGE18_02365 [Pseudomonadota bacterium]
MVFGASANAATFTTMSPTSSGALPAGVSAVGGVVVDLIGLNGTRVVSQLSASSLSVGFADDVTGSPFNPFPIGVQTGFDSGVTGALGGGIAEASFRFTLFDGDTGPGDFDEDENDLLVNGINFGDWSDVTTIETDGTGNDLNAGTTFDGFLNNQLHTGFFFSDDATSLASLFTSLVSLEQISFELDDVDPNDNFFDFTQGVDGSLINVGTGPTVTPPPSVIPVPAGLPLLLSGLGIFGLMGWRRRKSA